jgi:hypothetical protein
VDSARLTGGVAGLERLIKAGLSAGWVLEALRRWSDNMVSPECLSEPKREVFRGDECGASQRYALEVELEG